MLLLYRLVLYLLLPLLLVRLLVRAAKNSRYWEGLPQRFGFGLQTVLQSHAGGIWVHAVSVGEVNAALPLVKHLLTHYPAYPVVVTTMTPTGAARVRKLLGDAVTHCYLPYDYPGAVRRFFAAARPRLGLIMETEIWPNLITSGAGRNIPLLYTNVRLSQRSFEGYRRGRWLFAPVLGRVQHFYARSAADSKRLLELGVAADRVMVTGNIKFEIQLPPSTLEAAQAVRRDLGLARPVWVAGSTHEHEEARVLEAFARARADHPDLLLVIAPRHPERFNAVHRLCNRHGYQTVLRSQTRGAVGPDTDIYLADTMGELMLLIAAADFAYIGGSLTPVGGHNVLEACAASKAVIFGPHMFNFAEISDLVLARGAGIQVQNAVELAAVVARLATDRALRDQYGEAGCELVKENRGALAALVEQLGRYL